MKLIIECEGPVVDVQPVYWAAYGEAIEKAGLARTDPADFWRHIRLGSPLGRVVRGVVGPRVRDIETHFNAAVVAEAAWREAVAREDLLSTLRRLQSQAECILLATSPQRECIQKTLNGAGLSDCFTTMHKLFSEPSRRADQFRAIVDGDPRVAVAAASEAVVRAAADSGVVVAGITNGSCIARRLTSAGAEVCFGDLEELADEFESGAVELRRCGLLPQAMTF